MDLQFTAVWFGELAKLKLIASARGGEAVGQPGFELI
jgi:hypothetical protein